MATQTPLDVRYAWRAAWDFGCGKDVAGSFAEEAVHVRILVIGTSAMGDAGVFLD